jgi:chromosome segregation ATPase
MTQKTKEEPTNKQIFQAVQDLSTSMDSRFTEVDGRFTKVHESIHNLSASVDTRLVEVRQELKQDITGLRQEVKQDITDVRNDIGTLQESVANLITLVDKFTKIYIDLKHELEILRQHVRDAEIRIEKLEIQLKTA